MPQRFSTLEDWLAWFETLHPKEIDMSLERLSAVLDLLALRPPPYKVITVGGTNGKGSCVAILESIYREAGYKVGTFTSPHLWRFNERIRVDGEDASDGQLIEVFQAIDDVLDTVTLSYFESSAVAALLHFAREGVDVAVLEVGMGGRLDAVNALDADAALIATIDVDHQEWLGGDRESIGREKAGIMRNNRPAILGDRDPPASLVGYARDIGAELHLIGRDFDFHRYDEGSYEEGGDGEEGDANAWTYEEGHVRHPALPPIAFGGEVQYSNAAACVAVVERMRSELPVHDDALRSGLREARLRGRSERHLRGGVDWVFDVAHNPAAAKVFRSSVDHLPPAERTFAVFAAMHDKDIAGVLEHFAPIVEHWFLARADDKRGAPVEDLVRVLAGLGSDRVEACADIGAACVAAANRTQPGDRVLVFGSFYTVGPAMTALGLYSTPSKVGQ